MSTSYSSVRANFYVPFKMAITTTSTPQNFFLPFVAAGKYRCIVDWGDGSSQKVTSSTDAGISHSYATIGTYEINIKGLYTHLDFNVVTASQLLVSELRQWGNNFWKILRFTGCGLMVANYASGDHPITFQVTDMADIFNSCGSFNGSLAGWDVTGVTSMARCFNNASSFNQDLNSWKPSSCLSMEEMFLQASFNNGGVAWTGPNFGPNMGNVTTVARMFQGSPIFNQPIGNWDVSGVTNMDQMFENSPLFNQDLNGWSPSSCQSMITTFSATQVGLTMAFNNGGVAFTGPNFGPNLGSVITFDGMFFNSVSFNQPVDNWDVSGAQLLTGVFSNFSSSTASFNQNLNGWTPTSCQDMSFMLYRQPSFNNGGVAWTGPNFGPNLGSVTNMSSVFYGASGFNQPIGNWDVSSVTSMNNMFFDCSVFDQSIGNFNVSSVTNMTNILDNTNLSITNVNDTINGWATLAGTTGVNSGLTVGMTGLTADSGSSGGRLVLTSAPNNWTFSGLTVI